MGDIIHGLPAVADIQRVHPAAKIDWLVEESFSALPRMHPGLSSVITVAVRRWRSSLISPGTRTEIRAFRQRMAAQPYDFVIDLQGLTKSALLALAARGPRCGYAWGSGRDPFASVFYNRRIGVSLRLHAVERNRQLAAGALGYELPPVLDYGIAAPEVSRFPELLAQSGTVLARPYCALLHATSRTDKLWDEARWIALGRALHERGIGAVLPWGSTAERARSERLAAAIPDAWVPPKLALEPLSALLGRAWAVAGVDTGLTHLGVALGRPVAGIYCATEPGLNGVYGGDRAVNIGGNRAPPEVSEVLAALDRVTSN